MTQTIESPKTLKIGGVFTYEHIRDGKIIDTWEQPNLIVDEGLNYVLNAGLSSGSKVAGMYVGVYANNYTPIAGNVMSTFPTAGVALEVTTEISNATRPTWSAFTGAVTTTKSLTNSAAPAIFTFTASADVNGAFLSSTNTKGGTTGTLVAASKFASTRSMINGDVLSIIYTVNISST